MELRGKLGVCVARAPTEEEAADEEPGGQQQRPSAQPARAAQGEEGRVGLVKGVPHRAGRRLRGPAPLLRPG